MNKGQKYWTIGAWTAKGKAVWETAWQNDIIDQRRQRQGNVYLSVQSAQAALGMLDKRAPETKPGS